MSYYNIYLKYKDLDFNQLSSVDLSIHEAQFVSMLSPDAESNLEEMAKKAHEVTLRNFGRTMQLYTPMYLSNFCENKCVYCGFNAANRIERKQLSFDEVRKEADFIAATGLKHILILTGDSRSVTPLSYIKDCVKVLRDYFSSISVEIYALSRDEYTELIAEGVDGLTIYQEVYDEDIYGKMHLAGAKKDYLLRLDAPERGARAGMRNVNIGALLGLNDWRKEAFFLGLHAKYLQDNYPDTEIGVSLPRIRPQVGHFNVPYKVTDKNIVQILASLRIFLPRIGIALSTREDSELRDNLIPLGITRISAGSSTLVGGHTAKAETKNSVPQFEISDERDVKEMKYALEKKGYQPVLKDWMRI
jgi:2-iminoacetate synthase